MVLHALGTGSSGRRAGRVPARDAAWPGPGPARRRGCLGAWAEFTGDELGFALAEGRGRGEDLLTITAALETKLPGPPGGYGSRRLRTRAGGQRDLLVTLDPVTTQDCDHRYQAKGHDPGVKLRHLAQVRHATCTSPICRRPASNCDFEHNIPYEAGGRSCLCNGAPPCKR